MNIPRHKTAIRRASFSLPIKCLLRDGLLAKNGDWLPAPSENVEYQEPARVPVPLFGQGRYLFSRAHG
jgi:hypothetical protein